MKDLPLRLSNHRSLKRMSSREQPKLYAFSSLPARLSREQKKFAYKHASCSLMKDLYVRLSDHHSLKCMSSREQPRLYAFSLLLARLSEVHQL